MSKNPFANMGNLLKQAQEMQSKMGKIQEEAATKLVEATAGGGMVTIQANGAMQITKIVIIFNIVIHNGRGASRNPNTVALIAANGAVANIN